MTLDFSGVIKKIQTIEKQFNKSQDPVVRMACLNAINHIGRNELPFDENDWLYQQYFKASLRKFGATVEDIK